MSVRIVRMFRIVLMIFLFNACELPTRTKPGFCGSTDECSNGFICQTETVDPMRRHRCVCNATFCRDAGGDGAPDDGNVADADARRIDAVGTCHLSTDCGGDKPVCAGGVCVQCDADTHCAANPNQSFCVGNVCVGCAMAAAQACSTRSKSAPVCGPAGACVECTSSSQCAEGANPICEAQKCTPCTSDSQCAAKLGPNPGICMSHQDGRCASDSETIYIENKNGCAQAVEPSAGSLLRPYCSPKLASQALSLTRRVIVIRGITAGGFSWKANSFESQVTMVGQQQAAISPGVDIGVQVSVGDLVARDLTVRNGEDLGMSVDQGGVLRLGRVRIENNARGGLRVVGGSGYDVVNSTLLRNGGQRDPLVGFFGGAFLEAPGLQKPRRFMFNTVFENRDKGIICTATSQQVSACIIANNFGDYVDCQLTSSVTTLDGDPKLTSSGALTSQSPCRNAIAQAPKDAPTADIDGDPRPQEGKFDCGADELKP